MSEEIKILLGVFLIVVGFMNIGDAVMIWEKLAIVFGITIGFLTLFITAGVIK